MASQRFSFGLDDQTSSHPDEQERLNRNFETQDYRDAPTRDVISPPPHYASSNRPNSSIPTSPAPAAFHYPSSQQYPSASSSRNLREERQYLDDAPPPPPPPPPHRTSPTRLSQNSTVSRKPLIAGTSYEDRSGQPLMQTIRDPHSQDSSTATNTTSQFAGLQLSDRPNHSRGTSPHHFPQRPTSRMLEHNSYSSHMALGVAAGTPGSMTPTTPDVRSSRYSSHSLPLSQYSSPSQHQMNSYYHDSPYHSSSHDFDPTISNASINPYNIADDGDDGFMPQPKRKSALGLGRPKSVNPGMGAAAGTGAAAGAGMGGFFTHHSGKQAASSTYGPMIDQPEKSAWLAKQGKGGRRMRCMVGAAIGVFIVLAVVGGIVGGVFGSRKAAANNGSKTYDNAADDLEANGDLSINSAEIKALMNNPDLHKVFPGMDYTPWGVQYPLCNKYPPSQNNVTRDMAVISQLTNTVRLYGTDCNSTEMVLHAIDRLQLKDMKLWIGVWIDSNQTTNERQLAHMYHLLENVIKDHSVLKGVIIGNEALFRAGESKDEARTELATLLNTARTNITNMGWDLKVGTSDLGDNWNAALVSASDFVMSNIHPFFAGVEAEKGAAWTYSFWQQNNLPLTTSYPDKEQIIAETGWPSGGGTDCGGADGSCAAGQSGAVASVDNMNIFMNDWVCQALENGTNYFWFEAFDEAWKVQYNEPEKQREWEDKWGLMDTARKLKPGIKIPDCGGKTV